MRRICARSGSPSVLSTSTRRASRARPNARTRCSSPSCSVRARLGRALAARSAPVGEAPTSACTRCSFEAHVISTLRGVGVVRRPYCKEHAGPSPTHPQSAACRGGDGCLHRHEQCRCSRCALKRSCMYQDDRPQHTFDRDGILRALWADPIGSAAVQGAPTRLLVGEEYVDLQRLGAGVQRAKVRMMLTGGELSRSAVLPVTWNQLLVFMAPRL